MNHERQAVLAIEGGGVRTILSIVWAVEIEKSLGRTLGSMFGPIVGAGMGSILAAALALHIPPIEVLSWFRNSMPIIFKRTRRLMNRSIPFSSAYLLYDIDALAIRLRILFGNSTPTDFYNPLVLPALVETQKNGCEVMNLSRFSELPVWQVVAGCCADPRLFLPYRLVTDGESVLVTSPFVTATSQTLFHLINSIDISPKTIPILLLGYGRTLLPAGFAGGGILKWAPRIGSLMSESMAENEWGLIKDLPNTAPFALQVSLPRRQRHMDDAGSYNLDALEALAQQRLREDSIIDRISSCMPK